MSLRGIQDRERQAHHARIVKAPENVSAFSAGADEMVRNVFPDCIAACFAVEPGTDHGGSFDMPLGKQISGCQGSCLVVEGGYIDQLRHAFFTMCQYTRHTGLSVEFGKLGGIDSSDGIDQQEAVRQDAGTIELQFS
ncbi:hypothetical protein XF14_14785 [Burkholderia gladioli]|nr:hypothetical protein XF14_14785 [Burkholderia gladioli]